MDQKRALFWLCAFGLIAIGFVLGNPILLAIGAGAGAVLAYEQLLKRSPRSGEKPSINVS
jgi:hypothetical protein